MQNFALNQNINQEVKTMTKVQEFMKLAEEKRINVVTLVLNQWGGFFVRIFITSPNQQWIGFLQNYLNQTETQVPVERISSRTLYIPLRLEKLQTEQQPQPQPQPQPQTKSQKTSQTIKLKSFDELAEHFSLDLDLPEEVHENNQHLISNVYFSEYMHPIAFKREITGILLKFHRQKTHRPETTEIVAEIYNLEYESQDWKSSRIYASLEFIKDWCIKTDEEIEETIRKRQEKQKELSKEFARRMYEEYLQKGIISEEDFNKVLKAYEEFPETFIEEVETESYQEISQILESEQEEKKIEREKRLYQEEMEEIWGGYLEELERIEQEIELLKDEMYKKTKDINLDLDKIPEEFLEDAKAILKGLSTGYEKRVKELERKRRRLLKEYRTLRELYAEALRYYYIDESQANSLKDLALKTLQKLK